MSQSRSQGFHRSQLLSSFKSVSTQERRNVARLARLMTKLLSKNKFHFHRPCWEKNYNDNFGIRRYGLALLLPTCLGATNKLRNTFRMEGGALPWGKVVLKQGRGGGVSKYVRNCVT